MEKIKSILLVLILSIILSVATYAVFASELAGEIMTDLTSISAAARNEHTYEQPIRWILRDNEGNSIKYITQEQLDALNEYLEAARKCGAGTEWWNCSNHGYAWRYLAEQGIFTQAEYEEYRGNRKGFQNGPLKDLHATDIFELQIAGQCTISSVMSYLNNVQSHPLRVLQEFSAIYCLKHHKPVPTYYASFGSTLNSGDGGGYTDNDSSASDKGTYDMTPTFQATDYISVSYNENSRSVSGDTVTLSSAATNGSLIGYLDNVGNVARKQITKSNVRFYLTNKDTESLKNFHTGFGSYNTNLFAYALSFSEKYTNSAYHSGDGYSMERAQVAIWKETGDHDGNNGYVTWENENGGKSLYIAGKSVDVFESEVSEHKDNPVVTVRNGNPNNVSGGVNVNDSGNEPTGTTVYVNGNNEIMYRIGPFNMSDYAYVSCASAAKYSGSSSDVTVDKSLVGGIIYGEIVLNNGTVIPIGYNVRTGDTTFVKEPISADGKTSHAKIYYQKTSDRGENNRGNSDSFQTPSDYQYPWPKSIFYIDVPKDLCGDATNLTGINFEYRKTRTEGNGWIITGKYVRTTWEVKDEEYGCKEYTGGCSYETQTRTGGDQGGYHDMTSHKHPGDSCDGSCGGTAEEPEDCGNCCDHSHTCNVHFTCSHGYDACHTYYWDATNSKVELTQPFLASHDAHTYVELFYKPNKVNVRLTTNVTIDKYISKIDHVGEAINTYNSTSRQNKTNDYKFKNFLKAERGDRITYRIVLKNKQNVNVKVQVKDELPEYCIFESIKIGENNLKYYNFGSTDSSGVEASRWFITDWVQVPANGQTVITVTIIATAENSTISDTVNENKATLVSGNLGRDIGNNGITKDDDSVNYVRMVSNLNSSAVVNLAQINDSSKEIGIVLTSSDFYKIKEYNVSIEKYIYDVTHNRGNGVSNTLDTTLSATDARSIQKGMEESKKQANPVYVEYGDTVTYKIKIYNTTNTYAKFNDRNNEPYWAPDKVYVNIEDTLPQKYSNLKMSIESTDGSYSKIENQTSSNTKSAGALYQKYTATTNSTNGGKFSMTNVMVPGNGVTTITITLTVDEYTKGTIETNTVKFTGDMRDINYGKGWNQNNDNRCVIQNNSTNTSTKDYYILNNYNAFIDKFAYQYDELVLNENNSDEYDFTDEAKLTGNPKFTVFNKGDQNVLNDLRMNTSSTYSTYSETYKNAPGNLNKLTDKIREAQNKDTEKKNIPLSVDKDETVVYAIKVSNEATSVTNSQTNTGNKPATQVRVSKVTDHMQYGLEFQSIKAVIYKADGTTKSVLIGANSASSNVNAGRVNYHYVKDVTESGRDGYKYREYEYDVGQDTLLDPGEYIIYYVTVKITESDMFLYDLENNAELTVLTNINNATDPNNPRKVKDPNHNENIAKQQKSREYVRMKDLVIAGKVWLDFNKNGLMDDTITDYVNQTKEESLYRTDPSKLSTYYSINENAMMKNIPVKLYRSDGTLLRTTLTDDKGRFTFARYANPSDSRDWQSLGLYTTQYYNYDSDKGFSSNTTYQRIDKATGKDQYGNYTSSSQYISYYIEYEYDGVIYKATAYSGKDHLNKDGSYKGAECNHSFETNTSEYLTDNYTKEIAPNGKYKYEYDSNANEFVSVREQFNTNYEYITYNKAYNTDKNEPTQNGDNTSDLEFDKTDHTSQLLVNPDRVMTARSFIEELSQPNTQEATNYIPLFGYNASDVKVPYSRYLKFINLGLELREDVDISLTKDVYKVKTTIKGEEMEYNFNENRYKVENATETENGVEYTYDKETDFINGDVLDENAINNYMYDYPYGIELYESDYKFRNEQYSSINAVQKYLGETSELNVEVTYRIRVDNNKVHKDDELKEPDKLNNSYDKKNFEDTKETNLYVKVDEILDLYDENFIEYTTEMENGTKDDYILARQLDSYTGRYAKDDKQIKVAEAWYYKPAENGNYIFNKATGVYIDTTKEDVDIPEGATRYEAVQLKVSNNSTKPSLNEYINSGKYKPNNDNNPNAEGYDGYHKLYISGMGDEKIAEGSHLDIFVKYVLDKNEEEVTIEKEEFQETATEVSKDLYNISVSYNEATGEYSWNWASSNETITETNISTRLKRSLIVKEHTTTPEKQAYGLATENIAQVNLYSVWYADTNKPTSIVDRDSNAGNVGMKDTINKVIDSADNKKIYEDTIYKTGINITALGTANIPDQIKETKIRVDEDSGRGDIRRFIKGHVWDDSRSEYAGEEEQYKQYIGNGLRKLSSEKAIEEAKKNELVPIVKGEDITEETDIPVSSAKVEFIEIVETDQDKYYEIIPTDIICDYQQHIRSDGNGEYTLYGYTPGKYVVRFTYGDDVDANMKNGISETTADGTQASQEDMYLFNGQDYKSTQYTTPNVDDNLNVVEDDTENKVLSDDVILYNYEGKTDEKEITDANNKKIDKVIAALEAKDYNDARDDEIRRLETNSYSEIMDNMVAEILQGISNEKGLTNNKDANTEEELKALVGNTWMMAETIPFTVRAEKIDDELKEKVTSLIKDPTYANREQLETALTHSRTFTIENVDFGIEYRPENAVQLEKDIKEVKITTESGETVVDLHFYTEYKGLDSNEESIKVHHLDMEKSVGLDLIQFISNDYEVNDLVSGLISEKADALQGFVYINYDTDIQQGATVEITYEYIAENHGEVDRIAKNLDDIRYQNNYAITESSEKSAAVMSNLITGNKNQNGVTNYRANLTAANDMINNLYVHDEEGVFYRTSPKVLTTIKDGASRITNDTANANGASRNKLSYYGYYSGYVYYTGKITDFDTVAELKFNKILDYVDKDMVYLDSTTGEDTLDKNWSILNNAYGEYYSTIDWARSDIPYVATVGEIEAGEIENYINANIDALDVASIYTKMNNTDGLDGNPIVKTEVATIQGASIDPDGYVYENMLLSTDTSIYTDRYIDENRTLSGSQSGTNPSLSRFLLPMVADSEESNYSESRGKIQLTVSKAISAETNDDELQYENIGEIVEFTTLTGRRTNFAITIGNVDLRDPDAPGDPESPDTPDEYPQSVPEPDQSSTEVVTLIPPQGLMRSDRIIKDVVEIAKTGTGIVAVIVAVVAIGIFVTMFAMKKYQKRRIK